MLYKLNNTVEYICNGSQKASCAAENLWAIKIL